MGGREEAMGADPFGGPASLRPDVSTVDQPVYDGCGNVTFSDPWAAAQDERFCRAIDQAFGGNQKLTGLAGSFVDVGGGYAEIAERRVPDVGRHPDAFVGLRDNCATLRFKAGLASKR
jgi:hypothetical protein